jgi:hypothetical protein
MIKIAKLMNYNSEYWRISDYYKGEREYIKK